MLAVIRDVTAPPVLTASNPALAELRTWLETQRESTRDMLETETDARKIAHTQGRLSLVNDLLRLANPNHRRYGAAS